jgi:hypothetical protein
MHPWIADAGYMNTSEHDRQARRGRWHVMRPRYVMWIAIIAVLILVLVPWF